MGVIIITPLVGLQDTVAVPQALLPCGLRERADEQGGAISQSCKPPRECSGSISTGPQLAAHRP